MVLFIFSYKYHLKLFSGKEIFSPLGSAVFLNRYFEILSAPSHPEITSPEGIVAQMNYYIVIL